MLDCIESSNEVVVNKNEKRNDIIFIDSLLSSSTLKFAASKSPSKNCCSPPSTTIQRYCEALACRRVAKQRTKLLSFISNVLRSRKIIFENIILVACTIRHRHTNSYHTLFGTLRLAKAPKTLNTADNCKRKERRINFVQRESTVKTTTQQLQQLCTFLHQVFCIFGPLPI
jgi:hypothetical protein